MYITKSKFCCRIKLEIPRIDSKKKGLKYQNYICMTKFHFWILLEAQTKVKDLACTFMRRI